MHAEIEIGSPGFFLPKQELITFTNYVAIILIV